MSCPCINSTESQWFQGQPPSCLVVSPPRLPYFTSRLAALACSLLWNLHSQHHRWTACYSVWMTLKWPFTSWPAVMSSRRPHSGLNVSISLWFAWNAHQEFSEVELIGAITCWNFNCFDVLMIVYRWILNSFELSKYLLRGVFHGQQLFHRSVRVGPHRAVQ